MEVDETGEISYANPAARRIAEQLGLPGGVKAFLPPDLPEIFAAVREGGPWQYSYDLVLADQVYAVFLSFPHDLPTARLYALNITERQQAEEALRGSERHFREVVEALPQLVWTCQPHGLCDFLSKQWLAYTGLPEAEQLGYGWLSQIHPDDRAGLLKVWEASVATGAEFNTEFRVRRHDGVYRWFDTRALPLRDQDGRIVKWFGSNTDIQAQRELREALRESQKDLNRAQAVAHTGSWRMNVQKNELTWSEENHRIFGIPLGTPMTYETFLNTVHPEDREYVDRKWMAALEGEPYDIEHRIIVDGRVKWVRERAELEFDAQGQLLGGFGTTQDITERKQAEEAVHRAKEEWERTFNAVPDFIAILDKDHRIVRMNRAMAELLGKSEEEVLGQPCYKAVHGLDESPDFCPHTKVVATGRDQFAEVHEFGRIFAVSVSPLLNPDGHLLGSVHVARDVTERKQAEEALRQSEEHYRSLFNNMLNGFAYCQMHFEDKRPVDFTYLSVNHAFETLTGLKDVVGKKVSEVIPGIQKSDPKLFEIYGRVALTGAPERFEIFLEALAEWFSVSVYSPRLEYFVAIFEVITERRRTEEALRRAYDDLEERVAERTAALRLANEQLLWEIEERQQAEDRLRESEARFAAFMEHLPGLAAMRDVEGRYLFVNPAWEKKLGLEQGAWRGKTLAEVWSPKQAAALEKLDYQVISSGEPMEQMETVKLADGPHYFLASRFPIRDKYGLPYMVGTVAIDVTARQEAEAALAEHAALLQDLYNNAPCGYHSLDRDGAIVQINDTELAWLGYSREEVVGRLKLTDLLTPDSVKSFLENFPGFKARGWVKDLEYEMIRKDGAILPVLLSATAVTDKAGNYVMSRSTMFDITERKKAEEFIREQGRQLEAFFAHSLTPVVFLDPDFNFLKVNEAYARACRMKPEDFIERNHFELFPHPENQAIFTEVVRSKIPYQVQAKPFVFPHHPEWGVTYWDWSLTPILDQAGEVDFLVFSLRDVTRRVLSEQARGRLIEILEATPDFVGIADYSGQLQYLNQAGRALVGVGEDEDITRLRVLQLHPEWAGKRILEKGTPTATREGVWQAEIALLHRDGREIPVSQVILAHKEPTGRVGFFSTIARDISNIKEAQESILRQTAILNGINRIFREALASESKEELGRTCLSVARLLTDSQFGFIHEVNQRDRFDALAFKDPGQELSSRSPEAAPPLKNLKPVGLLAQTMAEGKVLIANDPAAHPEGTGVPEAYPALTSYLGMPLSSGGITLGLLGLGNKTGGYTQRDREAVESLAPVIVEALMHRRAEEALRMSERRLRRLADQLLTAQENERKRLAAELHDELGHALLALKLSLSSIEKKLPPEQDNIKNEIRSQQDYINEVIQDVRRLYHDLSPGDVEDLGLTKALRTLIGDFASHQPDITWHVNLADLEGLFSLPVQTTVYRIVQEALTNIGKHANPVTVAINAAREGHHVHFTIEDDGAGFDVAQVLGARASQRGVGLVAMEERVLMVGGAFQVHSHEHQGTRLDFTIPTLPEGESA